MNKCDKCNCKLDDDFFCKDYIDTDNQEFVASKMNENEDFLCELCFYKILDNKVK